MTKFGLKVSLKFMYFYTAPDKGNVSETWGLRQGRDEIFFPRRKIWKKEGRERDLQLPDERAERRWR